MRCPHCKPHLVPESEQKLRKTSYKYGSFWRQSDGRRISRYKCLLCNKTYSTATDDLAYYQKKRKINFQLKQLLSSNISLRRSAMILGVARKTIERKLIFLGKVARLENKGYLAQFDEKIDYVQLDELQTIEHTKCKPLAVMVAISAYSRKILAIEVSPMPATGHLAKISRRKYGFRPDLRVEGLQKTLKKISALTNNKTVFHSDMHPFYPNLIKHFFPQNKHLTSKGIKATVSGQGELKRHAKDPLFYINHTLAMMRANINRLIRKTWCTTKDPARLRDHLAIYMSYHNQFLTVKF